METKKRELQRIGVFAAVKKLFLVGGVGGLLIGMIQWLILSVALWSGSRAGLEPGDFIPGLDQALGTGIGILGLMLPAFGAVAGAVGGVVFGFLLSGVYNMGARFWGGLEFDITEPAPEEAMPQRAATDSETETPLPGIPAESPPARPAEDSRKGKIGDSFGATPLPRTADKREPTESTDRPPPPGFE